MAKNNIIINVEDGRIVRDFFSTLEEGPQIFVYGDKVDMAITGVRKNTGIDAAERPWTMVDMAGKEFRIATGTEDRLPFTGDWGLLTSDPIAFDADAGEVETSLNAETTISAEGGVTVTAFDQGGWRLTYNTVGVKTALSAGVNTMLPSSDIFVTEQRAGDGSTQAVVLVSVETQASAYLELNTDIESPTVIIEQVRNGNAGTGVSEVQRIYMTGEAVSGTYALTLDAVATGEIAFDADAIDITTAIAALPIIGGDETLVTVTGDSRDFTVTFDSSLDNLSSMVVDYSNLNGLNGKQGVFDLNTVETLELLNGANQAQAIFEIVWYDTDNSQGETVHQSNVTILQDIIASVPPSVTPIPTYADQSHTHVIADVTGLQGELDTLESVDVNQQVDIDAVEARMDTAESDITAIEVVDAAQQIEIDANTEGVSKIHHKKIFDTSIDGALEKLVLEFTTQSPPNFNTFNFLLSCGINERVEVYEVSVDKNAGEVGVPYVVEVKNKIEAAQTFNDPRAHFEVLDNVDGLTMKIELHLNAPAGVKHYFKVIDLDLSNDSYPSVEMEDSVVITTELESAPYVGNAGSRDAFFTLSEGLGTLTYSATTITAPNLVHGGDPDSLVKWGDLPNNVIVVNEVADFGVIDSSMVYLLGGIIDMGSTSLEVPAGGINIIGYTFDTSKLISSAAAYTMFTSPAGGSGNILGMDYAIEVTGAGSQVYNVVSDTGNEAFEFSRINYNDCTSLGTIDNYRQGLEVGTGRFGGTPELTLKGVWAGGYFIDTSIVRELTDGAYSLFKAGVGFLMSSRFRTNQNVDLNATVSLFDFAPANFVNPSTVQLDGAIVTRNGVSDASDSTIIPNMAKGDLVANFTDNIGIDNTFVGGRVTDTVETATTITTQSVFVDVAGTWTSSDLQHFDSAVSNTVRLRHLGDNPRSYKVIIDMVVDGPSNDEVAVKVRRWDDSAASFVDEFTQIRQINSLVGGRNVAFFNINTNLVLDMNDYVSIQLANNTGTGNLTAELDSVVIVEAR